MATNPAELRIDPETRRKLDELAQQNDTSPSKILAQAIDAFHCSLPPRREDRVIDAAGPDHVRAVLETAEVNWNRWHALGEIKAQRALTESEQREYDGLRRIVDQLDDEEEAVAARARDALTVADERALASIDRLIDAVKAAAERVPAG